MEYTQIPGTDFQVSRVAWEPGLSAAGCGAAPTRPSPSALSMRPWTRASTSSTRPRFTVSAPPKKSSARPWLRRNCRDKVFISTKTGLDWQDGKVFRNCSPDYLKQNFADSLKNLQTDYVDILYIHWPDPREPFAETARVMHQFLKEGKIKAVGVSNYSPEQIQAFQQGGPVHIVQPPYNLFEREIEADLMPFCHKNNLHLMTYGALCRGLLSGKVTADRTFEGDDLRNKDPKFRQPRLDQYLAAVQRLDASPGSGSIRASFTWRYAGCSTTAPTSHCGVAGGRTRWIRCPRSWAGTWIKRPWTPSRPS